jgi:Zn-dependent peptidase ImmA (M78 family)
VPDQAIEREANDFASEFLMPARDISLDFDSAGRLTVESLAELKRKWKTSMAALLERAKRLGKVTEGQHRWLRIRLGELGYLKQEPRELEPRGEEPSVLREMVALHTGELGYSADELARLLREKPDAIRELYLSRPRLRAV